MIVRTSEGTARRGTDTNSGTENQNVYQHQQSYTTPVLPQLIRTILTSSSAMKIKKYVTDVLESSVYCEAHASPVNALHGNTTNATQRIEIAQSVLGMAMARTDNIKFMIGLCCTI